MCTQCYGLQPNDLFSSKIQSLCPTITGNVCCTEKQFDTLRAQVQQVRYFIYLNFGILLVHCIMKLVFLLAFGWPASAVFSAFMVLIIKYKLEQTILLLEQCSEYPCSVLWLKSSILLPFCGRIISNSRSSAPP